MNPRHYRGECSTETARRSWGFLHATAERLERPVVSWATMASNQQILAGSSSQRTSLPPAHPSLTSVEALSKSFHEVTLLCKHLAPLASSPNTALTTKPKPGFRRSTISKHRSKHNDSMGSQTRDTPRPCIPKLKPQCKTSCVHSSSRSAWNPRG